MRAFLIVPGDARAVAAAMASDAHALIVDVTGLASPAFFPERRQGAPLFYLRSCELERDLSAMMAVAPDGIVLSRCEGARDVTRLGARLAVEEAIHGLADGSTQILPLIETSRGTLTSHTLADASGRLAGIAWDAEAIRAEIGALTTRDRGGALRPAPRSGPLPHSSRRRRSEGRRDRRGMPAVGRLRRRGRCCVERWIRSEARSRTGSGRIRHRFRRSRPGTFHGEMTVPARRRFIVQARRGQPIRRLRRPHPPAGSERSDHAARRARRGRG